MTDPTNSNKARPKRVLLLGATGTIGIETARVLLQLGHELVCCIRSQDSLRRPGRAWLAEKAQIRTVSFTDARSFSGNCIRGENFDALISCMASRTGAPEDAWAVDYRAHMTALSAAVEADIPQMVLLSAICVQKPLLAFQHAKLAFENALIDSGMTYSIVRPTAYFKSLSGQVERLKRGRPYLVFGDGKLTSCKPISDHDLACYLADCLHNPELQNRILPIGGPGGAITPIEQGERLFALLGRRPRFRHVPVAFLDGIVRTLDVFGRAIPALKDKAELARIGRYYATESMLLLDPDTGLYDAAATPSTGSETLFDHYAALIEGKTKDDRGEHAVF